MKIRFARNADALLIRLDDAAVDTTLEATPELNIDLEDRDPCFWLFVDRS